MTNLDSVLKSRDITQLTKIPIVKSMGIVKSMVFPLVSHTVVRTGP